jgi:transcriptional regulator with XRE-family HTH domain
MKIPHALPISPEQSRAARFHLGLSQTEVIKQSELPGHKLKNFETGRFIPDMKFLQSLADFYTSKGVDLTDVSDEDEAKGDPKTPPAPAKPGSNKVAFVQRPCFYVSDTISPELLDQCLERMHANDQRIAEILKKDLRSGMLGGYSQETEKEHQELFGAMAEGYLIFRLLQGTPIVPAVDGGAIDPKSHADLLSQFYAQSPVSNHDQAAAQPEPEGEEVDA